jgi:hypothetical protein
VSKRATGKGGVWCRRARPQPNPVAPGEGAGPGCR